MKALTLVLVLAQISLARAETPKATPATANPATATPSEDVEAARAHYRKGKTYFDLQRYHDAAREYEAAYEAKNDPALLFNIGQSYRLAGEYPPALGAYRSYLRNLPNARNRVDVERRIADLQEMVDRDRRNREAPPHGIEPVRPGTTPSPTGTGEATPADAHAAEAPATETLGGETQVQKRAESPARKRSRWLGLGLVGGGAAAIITGGVLTGLAYGIRDSQSHPGPNTTYDPSAPGRILGDQIGGGTLLGVGIAAAAAGTVIYFVGGKR
jgi:tetratricopeptide (TPR) repeat protein